ncbi:MAG TPA: heme exporter protein CcmB [Steroidobacteraceae bacterium]|nr:heme exporter protein CcmB [Steroidobacteraceae bacterium]
MNAAATMPAVSAAVGLPRVAPWTAARALLARDLRLALRRRDQLVQPLAFFALVTTLFPLAVSPESSQLRMLAPGALWVGALLAALLALDALFREDAHDGTLEQLVLSGQPLALLLLAKTAAHWVLTGLPLSLMAPLLGFTLGVPAVAFAAVTATMVLGSVALSLIGAIGAALTLGIRRSGVLLAILILPLAVPILIFGARATTLAIRGQSIAAPMELLAALAVLALTLGPLAAAAAVRIGLE